MDLKIESKTQEINSKSEAKLLLEKSEQFYSCYEYLKAIDCLNKAIQLKNDYAEAYFLKGRSLEKLSREKEALECFSEAIKYQHIEAYNFKGFLLLDSDKSESIQLFEKALQVGQ